MDLKTKILIFSVYTLILGSVAYFEGKGDLQILERTQIVTETDIIIKEKIIIKPGGERIIYRETKDNSRRTSDRIKYLPGKDWLIGLSVGVHGSKDYTLTLDRKIYKNLFMGVYGRNNGELGVSLRYTF